MASRRSDLIVNVESSLSRHRGRSSSPTVVERAKGEVGLCFGVILMLAFLRPARGVNLSEIARPSSQSDLGASDTKLKAYLRRCYVLVFGRPDLTGQFTLHIDKEVSLCVKSFD